MSQNFVFLEIVDPEINGLLHAIRSVANRKESSSNIHVTLRGPYDSPVPPERIKRIERNLLRDDLLLANPAAFENDREVVIYLAVTHKYLKSVSWKRDYPVAVYGFNPHISLYVGTDKERAARLLNFLKQERLELICRDFRVTSFRQKEMLLFEAANDTQFFFPELINKGKIRADFVVRLQRALDRY